MKPSKLENKTRNVMKIVSENNCDPIRHSIHYRTRDGKTLVYELGNTSDYGINLFAIPSETKTVATKTYYAEEHVLTQPETCRVLPLTHCFHLVKRSSIQFFEHFLK